MANLKNINFMSQDRFESTETADDELYAVDIKNDQQYKEMVVGWGMPDYSKAVSVSEGNIPNPAPFDMLVVYTGSATGTNCTLQIKVDNFVYDFNEYGGSSPLVWAIVPKDSAVTTARSGGGFRSLRYIPLKGAN